MGWFTLKLNQLSRYSLGLVTVYREVDDDTKKEYMRISEINGKITSVKFAGEMAEWVDKELGVAS
jgi:hypothetical protein